ncbi:MAG: hypothetical protein JWM16_4969 [Verrucomicrobiales bacterium]|jgi:uncharacterized protein (DUF488 family)|nr:hypothetical protein [Verrucomicrobiales bacterium]
MGNEGLTIWTIGHSNKLFSNFLSLLRSQQIEFLADVRRFPGSRRYPHFNQESLEKALGEEKIQYVHFPELGGKRATRHDSRNMGWQNLSFRGYADHMETPEFQDGLAQLKQFAGPNRTAIMCAEVLWWQCHRALISDILKAQGARVLHILGPNKVEEHPFTSPARIVNGNLTYPPEPELQGQLQLLKT